MENKITANDTIISVQKDEPLWNKLEEMYHIQKKTRNINLNDMGFNPNTWGKQGWHFIHMVALAYPENVTEEVKAQYHQFLKSLGSVLPCPYCGLHYTVKFQNTPPNLNSREELFRWTVDVHNEVNRDNHKPELSYAEALAEVHRNATPTNDYLKHGLIFSASAISAIVLISYIASTYKN